MSALVSIGSAAVIDARLTMPRVGVWVLEASLQQDDGERPPSGQVLVHFGEEGKQLELTGTVSVASSAYGATVARVKAGAGGMGTPCTAKHWRSTTVGTVLKDLLDQAGERLSTSCTPEVMQSFLAVWTITRQPVGQAITSMLEYFEGVTWRTLPDGTVFVGRESWPKVAPDHELLQEDPLNDKVELASLDRLVLPGDSFMGRHVSNVEHSLLDERFRTQVWFEK